MKDYRNTYIKAQNALDNNNLKSALKFCNICKKINPQDPGVWALLGAIYGKGQNYFEAEKCYRKTLEINPDISEAWRFLAITKVFQGDLGEQTISFFDKALELNNRNVKALVDKACLFRDLGQLEKAVSIFDQALSYEPENVEALLNKGNALKTIGSYEDSLECFNRIISKHPNHHSVMASRALVYYHMGNYVDADNSINIAIQSGVLDPLVAQAYAEISKNTDNISDAINYIEKVIVQGSAVHTEKDDLHYVAARLYDRSGIYEKAFEHIEQANKRKSKMFDVGYYGHYLSNMKSVFTGEFINKKSLDITSKLTPVFIVGMPRSGSSLLEQILSCHPEISAGGELTSLLDILTKVAGVNAKSEKLPQRITELDSDELETIANEYYKELDSVADGKVYITDKLPTNYERIGMIKMLFPGALIIHTTRNPLDTCISCLFQNFGNNHTYVNSMPRLAKVYKLYSELMDYWTTLPDISIHEVHYERLVCDPEETIGAALKYCGLPWSDRCLEFHKSDRLTKTASYDQVRQPLYKKSIDRWKHYEKYIKPLIDELSC